MGTEDNGLTLQGLAQRLEALERENAELRSEVAALRGSGTPRSGDGEQASEEFEGQVSRRSLLCKAGAAAVAAMAAGTLLNTRQAKANHFDDAFVEADWINTHSVAAWRHGTTGSIPTPADTRFAVLGQNINNAVAAVIGSNEASGPGVQGKSASGPGVKGEANNGPGVLGHGVIGVRGSSATNGQAGVYGEHDLFGPGVVGDGHGENFAGVLGRNGIGHGVQGESRTQTTNFAGVRGIGSTGVWGSSSRTGSTPAPQATAS